MNPGRMRVFLAGMKYAGENDPDTQGNQNRIQRYVLLSLNEVKQKYPSILQITEKFCQINHMNGRAIQKVLRRRSPAGR
mgnify:CR=1 FL=1